MKIFVVLLLAVAAVSAGSFQAKRVVDISPKVPFYFPENRITNGKLASAGQFPYQAGLKISVNILSYSVCGGSLIATNWVVTAAHCTYKAKASAITVYLGSTTYGQGTAAPVQEIIVHENWNPDTISNDISLLRINPVSLGPNIQVVPLPPLSDSNTYVNTVGVASGWGKIKDSGSAVSSLYYADLPIVANSICSDVYGTNIVKPDNICVATTNGISTCNGDSGGPLVSKSTGVLLGITSFGAAAGCTLQYPAAFVRVTSFRGWINAKTGL